MKTSAAYVCMYIFMNMHKMYICAYVHVYMCIFTYAYMFVCRIYVCTCVCVYVCIVCILYMHTSKCIMLLLLLSSICH